MEIRETNEAKPEVESVGLRDLSTMNAKVLSQILDAHIMSLTQVMISGNKVSYAKKLQAEKALRQAIRFALDFDLNVTKATIPQQGQAFAQESANIAGVLVKAIENNMVLKAYKLQDSEGQEPAEAQDKADPEISNLVENLAEADAKINSGEITTAEEYLNTVQGEQNV